VLLFACRAQGAINGPLPADYATWTRLKAFELTNTQLAGTIPSILFSAWSQLENFTIHGAILTGYLPPPWQCTGLKQYTVQNTPVTSNASQPLWVLDARAANLMQITGIGLGKGNKSLCFLSACSAHCAFAGWLSTDDVAAEHV
jgi:hypothetical protein